MGSSLKECNIVHENKYIYPETNKNSFHNRRSKIEIICKTHGVFYKTGQKHLTQGCPLCSIDQQRIKLLGNYGYDFFEKYPEKQNYKAVVYYIKLNNYYKVGITINLKRRINAIKSKSKIKNIEILDTLDCSLYNAYQLEQFILNTYKHKRVYSDWSTELFNCNVIRDKKLHELMNNYIIE